jgi:hypothetical protein
MQKSMGIYPRAAVERAMKIQEVILRAIAKKITWSQAAEIADLNPRHMRRLRWRYENLGLRRAAGPSPGAAERTACSSGGGGRGSGCFGSFARLQFADTGVDRGPRQTGCLGHQRYPAAGQRVCLSGCPHTTSAFVQKVRERPVLFLHGGQRCSQWEKHTPYPLRVQVIYAHILSSPMNTGFSRWCPAKVSSTTIPRATENSHCCRSSKRYIF